MNSFLASPLKAVYYRLLTVCLTGNTVECPVCGKRLRRFRNFSRGPDAAPGSLCPSCFSLERHRLLWLFLRDRTDLFDESEKTIFHVAPEPCFRSRLMRLHKVRYAVSDLRSPDERERIDVTAINLPDNSVDSILCNHVLEHVLDDRKAMRELYRILKKNGWAVINVPVDYNREVTYEDASITDPRERRRLYGLDSHVRVYGQDYGERLKEAGFKVEEIDYVRDLGKEKQKRFALLEDERIYYCRKQL